MRFARPDPAAPLRDPAAQHSGAADVTGDPLIASDAGTAGRSASNGPQSRSGERLHALANPRRDGIAADQLVRGEHRHLVQFAWRADQLIAVDLEEHVSADGAGSLIAVAEPLGCRKSEQL